MVATYRVIPNNSYVKIGTTITTRYGRLVLYATQLFIYTTRFYIYKTKLSHHLAVAGIYSTN